MKESFTREIKRKGNIIFKKYCRRKHPPCPVCGKASFLHNDYEHYSNYRCTDKYCNHSFFVWKSAAVTAPSMSTLFGKHNFKRMRYPVQIIITALSMFYFGISVSYLKLPLISRFLIPLSAIGALNSPRCLTIYVSSLFPY